MYRLFNDGEAPSTLESLPKRKTADEIAWGSSDKHARFLSNFRRVLRRVAEKDRILLISFAQKLASKHNGRKSVAASARHRNKANSSTEVSWSSC